MSGNRVWKVAAGLDGRVVIEGQELSVERGGIVLRVRPHAGQPLRCGRCGRRGRRYDGGEGRRVWRHLDFGPVRVWLEAEAPRVACLEHGPTVTEVSWARHNAGHTYAFDAQVAWLAVHTAKTTVQQLMRIGWRTVGAIVERVKADLDTGVDRLAGLRRIGIDEISYKKQHKYLTVVVCHDTGRLVWAGVGASEKTLAEFFTALGEERSAAITHVSCDQARWIAKAVAAWCPNAVRAADPFHVVAWAIDALDAVRRRVWNAVRTPTGGRSGLPAVGEGKKIKDIRWALWKNPETLKDNQAAALDWLRTAHPVLHRAYEYKERLRLIFKLPIHAARTALKRWIKAAKLSRIPELRELAFRIGRHHDAILTAIEHGLSNGRVESINTKIRLLTRTAYGFHNPHALIALALLALGGYALHLPQQTLHTPQPRT